MKPMPSWQHLAVERIGPVLEVRQHTDGGPMIWSASVERELTEFFTWVAEDQEAKVIILAGTGDSYCASIDSTEFRNMSWRETWGGGQRLLTRMMEINCIILAAVHGPAHFHSEIPVMADIVIASPTAEFADLAHLARGIVPGDGVQLVWGNLLGSRRAGYFFLTNERLGASEAQRLGVVHEIHAQGDLLARARSIASDLAQNSAALLTYTKAALRIQERRNFHHDMSHSISIEGLGIYTSGMRKAE